jgi:hypothetical protein
MKMIDAVGQLVYVKEPLEISGFHVVCSHWSYKTMVTIRRIGHPDKCHYVESDRECVIVPLEELFDFAQSLMTKCREQYVDQIGVYNRVVDKLKELKPFLDDPLFRS